MSEIEIKQMQEKINAGILLARKRLIEKVKKEDVPLLSITGPYVPSAGKSIINMSPSNSCGCI